MAFTKVMERYPGIFIGFCFSLFCAAGAFIALVPDLLVLPATYLLDTSIGLLQGKQDYNLTGWSGLTFLLILVVTSSFLYHRKVRVKLHLGKKLHIVDLIFFLVFQLFTFPALLFYLKSSLDWEKSLYSQHYTQSIREVFPWCALPFVFIGFYWDWLRNHSGLRNPKYDEDW